MFHKSNLFSNFDKTKLFTVMRMYTKAFNQLRDLQAFVNSEGIAKENILSAAQQADGTYALIWYAA